MSGPEPDSDAESGCAEVSLVKEEKEDEGEVRVLSEATLLSEMLELVE